VPETTLHSFIKVDVCIEPFIISNKSSSKQLLDKLYKYKYTKYGSGEEDIEDCYYAAWA